MTTANLYQDYGFYLLLFNGLMVVGIFVLLLGRRKESQQAMNHFQNLEKILSELQIGHQDARRQTEAKLDRLQAEVQDRLANDREKQLKSLAEQRLSLEQRFADSNKTFITELHQFKQSIQQSFDNLKRATSLSLEEGNTAQTRAFANFNEKLSQLLEQQQTQSREQLAEHLRKGLQSLREDLDRSIQQQNELLTRSIGTLTENTDNRLKEISGQVEKRLADGFDKTTQTFQDVLKRLALIDDAQKKITELSTNVVSLQEILNDKRSRGAFGEVQLQSLVSNVIPDSHYQMQASLSNGKRVDCLLTLPEPTGLVAIDAKFPLDSYKKMCDVELGESDRRLARKQFELDIRKHIKDIAEKYIIDGETADGAVMFIPAESVFAEIHGHYPELVEFAWKSKVWLVSPTTMMAILTTAAAVIKDEQTRKQVHIIKEHLGALGKDFSRFQTRMDNLAKHIGQAQKDVELVHTSAKKISSRFSKIEKVELADEELQLLPADQDGD